MKPTSTAKIKPLITYDELDRIDIRVGAIQRVEDIPGADHLVRLIVDFRDHTRNILAAIKQEREDPREILRRNPPDHPPDLFPPRPPRTRALPKMKSDGEPLEQAVRPGRKQVRLRFAKGIFRCSPENGIGGVPGRIHFRRSLQSLPTSRLVNANTPDRSRWKWARSSIPMTALASTSESPSQSRR